MNDISAIAFPTAEERAQRVRDEFNADFKKRWKAKGDCGEFTNDIWAWQEMLEQSGWEIQLYARHIAVFTTFVDFDAKLIVNNNPKAFHAQGALREIVDRIFADAKGRWLFYWEEVHDEAHRHVRDGDEYKDSPYYMTVWYSMELRVREMAEGEDLPLPSAEEIAPVML
jgi:murein L,D-transpeptidase YafK